MIKNKTDRKNKTKQTVNWPSSYFTISSLIETNKHMLTASGSDITLRVRLNNSVAENKLGEIGNLPATKGRPVKVYVTLPVDANVINAARAAGVILQESFNSVKIGEVLGNASEQPTTTRTKVTTNTTVVA